MLHKCLFTYIPSSVKAQCRNGDHMNDEPIPADWTRITVHLGGSMHQMQLPSDKLYQWTEMLENELGLQDFRGTEAGAVLARELVQQVARHRLRDKAAEFGPVWGV